MHTTYQKGIDFDAHVCIHDNLDVRASSCAPKLITQDTYHLPTTTRIG